MIKISLNDIRENSQKRLPTKINSSRQTQKDNHIVMKLEDNTNNIDSTRICSDCNTTKTPLWRSGPRGPKSLCNACGIRQRKARRRAMAAAAAANGSNSSEKSTTKIVTKVQNKEKTSRHDQYLLPYNKRFRDDHHGIDKDGRFEDFFISLSKKFDYHRVFPKDEEEAAILLMAISSGLVHG